MNKIITTAVLTLLSISVSFAQWTSGGGNTTTSDNVGIGIDPPTADLHLVQSGDFLIGENMDYTAGEDPSKLFFMGQSGVFRSGFVNTTNWDDDSLGSYSFAVGKNPKATAQTSIAIGENAFSTAGNAVSIGNNVHAAGNANLTIGNGFSPVQKLVNTIDESIMIGSKSTVPSITILPGSTGGTAGFVGINTTNPQHELDVSGNVAVSGQIIHPSDERLKTNITSLTNALETVEQLKAKQYEYKHDEFSNMNLPQTTQYGLLAQDVEQVLPQLIHQNGFKDEAGQGYKGMNYEQLIPLLVQAVNELKVQNDDRQKVIEELMK